MTHAIRTSLFAASLAAFTLASFASPPPARATDAADYSLEITEYHRDVGQNHSAAHRWSITDFDGDGTDEVVATNPRSITLLSLEGDMPQLFWERRLAGRWRHTNENGVGACADVDGDGVPEILLSRVLDNVHVIDVIDRRKQMLLSCSPFTGEDANDDGVWEASLSAEGVVISLDGDERLIIAAGLTGLDKNVRRVIAYSAATGEERWHYDTGPNPSPSSFRFVDLDGQPGDEIIFTMESPCNRRQAGDTDDCFAYVVVLRADGSLYWLRILGGRFCHPTGCEVMHHPVLGPLLLTTTMSLAAGRGAGGSSSSADTLSVLAGRTGELLDWRLSHAPYDGLALIGEQQLVVSSTDGALTRYAIEENGTLVEEDHSLSSPPIRIMGAVDLIGHGQHHIGHIVGIDREMALVAVNRQLETEGRYQLEGNNSARFRLGHIRRGTRPPLLCVQTSNAVYYLEARSRPLDLARLARGAGVPITIGALTLALGLGVVAWVLLRRHRRRRPSPALRQQLGASLLRLIGFAGHGDLSVTKTAERIENLLARSLESTQTPPGFDQRFAGVVADFGEVTVPAIDQIVALAANLELDSVSLAKITRAKDDLTSAIGRVIDDHCSSSVAQCELPAIRTAVATLDSELRSLRETAAGYFSLDITRELERVIEVLGGKTAASRATIDLRVSEDVRGVRVRAGDDMSRVLENLLANAIRSVRDSQIRSITLDGWRTDSRFHLRIADTGCGMSIEESARLFEVGVSPRQGGGKGLFHSRMSVENYGGSLRLVESAEGKGTIMELKLALSQQVDPAGNHDGAESAT